MEIYLLRHGKAEPYETAKRDRDRRLTSEGVESMQEEIPGIEKQVPKLDHVLTSPYPRASETAVIAARAFGLEKQVKDCDGLCESGAEEAVLKALKKLPDDAAVMLVGHSPLMGDLAEFLSGSQKAYALKKGGLCKITFPGKPAQGKGAFEWILRPKELKSMAKD